MNVIMLASTTAAIAPADWWSISLSIVAILMSGAALIWNFLQWRRSGAILEVEVAPAVGVGGMAPFDELIAITVRNTGRGPAHISGWGIRFDDDSHVPGHAQQVPMNPDMPFDLVGGAAKTFWLPLRPTAKVIADHDAPELDSRLGCRGYVLLGTGEEQVKSDDLGISPVLRDAVMNAL